MNRKVKLVDSILIGLVMLAVSLNAFAQLPQSNESLIEQLQSTSPEVRTKASQYIFGAGIESAELYEVVSNLIKNQLTTLNKKSPKKLQQEIAWHTKALSSSGNEGYMPLLDELSNSPARTVAKYAKQSKNILAQAASRGYPYLDYNRVMVITSDLANECEFIKQRNCKTYRSLSKCVDSHKAHAAQAGGNSIVVLHDSDQISIFKSAMMANYYKCGSENIEALAITSIDAEQIKPETPSYISELKALVATRSRINICCD